MNRIKNKMNKYSKNDNERLYQYADMAKDLNVLFDHAGIHLESFLRMMEEDKDNFDFDIDIDLLRKTLNEIEEINRRKLFHNFYLDLHENKIK